MARTTAAQTSGRDTTAEITYLARALKAPSLAEAVKRLGQGRRSDPG